MTRVHQLLEQAKDKVGSNGENTLQRAVEGLLWKVEREEQFTQNKKSGKSAKSKEGDSKDEDEEEEEEDLYDLMVSYSWADKELVRRIFHHMRDQLGYKVWIDEEQMHGSTIEAMVRGSCSMREEIDRCV